MPKNRIKKCLTIRMYDDEIKALDEIGNHISENRTNTLRLLVKQRHDRMHKHPTKKKAR